MTGDPEPISVDARRALEHELADLRKERGLVAASLRDKNNDDVGDRGDEADELRRADQLQRLDNRIEQITVRLRQADLAGPVRTDEVGVGSTVTVRFPDGSTDTFHVGELPDAEDEQLVTSHSPLGSALLGHRPGDTVRYDTPEGHASAVVVSIG
ncbi:GreA/GreB family elongation factor [Streptomyces sp. NPDC047085]|jgi:transcription elongation factor GreA|uniref:GreA/GreB family elongation factor n=1 Tax=Streptomyces sp. NPDC047085 TaxID=3155140 RepID=UPI0033D43954